MKQITASRPGRARPGHGALENSLAQEIGAAIVRGLRGWDKIGEAAAQLRLRTALDIVGTAAASRPALASALWTELSGQLLVWSASQDSADRFANDCSFYTSEYGPVVHTLRPRDDQPNALVNPTERADRIAFLDSLASGEPGIYCISHAAARQPLPEAKTFASAARRLQTGREYKWEETLRELAALGYERVEVVSAVGEYAVRGGIIDVFPATAEFPVRLEFFGDRVEQIRTFAIVTQRSLDELEAVRITPWSEDIFGDKQAAIWSYAPGAVLVVDEPDTIVAIDHGLQAARDQATVAAADFVDDKVANEFATLHTPHEVANEVATLQTSRINSRDYTLEALQAAIGARATCSFYTSAVAAHLGPQSKNKIDASTQPAPAFGRSIERFVEYARAAMASKTTLAIASVGYRRIAEVLEEHDVSATSVPKRLKLPPERGGVMCGEGMIDAGFVIPSLGLAVVGDNELYGHPARRHKRRPAKEGVPVSVADLNPEDYLVHAHHGIGQYLGLEHIIVEDVGRDFMRLAYAGGDRLYVPVDQMHLVRKYAVADGAAPRLSKMGGSDWVRTRSRVREAVERIAEGLVRLYAARELAVGHAFAP